MQIILSVLQFIGIALLVLLGIVLFLILLILFYPICYTIEGELYSEKSVKAKVSWLFHLIRAKLVYEDDVISAKVGIFWKTIPFSYEFSTKTESEDESEAEWDINEESNIDINTDIMKETYENTEKEIVQEDIEKNDKSYIQETVVLNEKNKELDSTYDGEQSEFDKTDLNATDEILQDTLSETDVIDKQVDNDTTESNSSSDSHTSGKTKNSFIEKIKRMISKIKGTINKIKQVWNEIKTILTDEQNKSAVKHIKNEGIYLLKIFLPVKSKVNGVFSTGSPNITGQAFGIIALFPFMYKNEWSLRPDFVTEKAYFEGSFYFKGRIYLYKMILSVLRILFDKNCRRLYKLIKRFMHNVKQAR